MADIDLEKLAREAGFSFNADHGDYPLDSTAIVGGIENMRSLAALVLKEVANKAVYEGITDISADDDEIVANYLRTIAEGLKP